MRAYADSLMKNDNERNYFSKWKVKGIIFTYINICINQYIRIYCLINKDKCLI